MSSRVRDCPGCGSEFWAQRKDDIYCSYKCAMGSKSRSLSNLKEKISMQRIIQNGRKKIDLRKGSKTYSSLLSAFIKSNKQRRERIAQLNGMKNAEEYLFVVSNSVQLGR